MNKLKTGEPTYNRWFDMLKKVAVREFGFTKESAESFDKEAWKQYFDDGMSPYQALREDLSYD